MPKIHFTGQWSIAMTNAAVRRMAGGQTPGEGMLLLRVDPGDVERIRESFSRLHTKQQEQEGRMFPLDVTVEYGNKRSLDANRLMWALYDFEARCANAGRPAGAEPVTKDDLYRRDMAELADSYQLVCREADLPGLRLLGWTWRSAVPVTDRAGWMEVEMIVTSSKWDSMRMHRHLQYKFNQLAEMEDTVRDRRDLLREWSAWRQELNDQRIVLDESATEAQYREANPICEGCGTYIGHGAGEIHHISSRGSRALPQEQRETPMNWLHLCGPCHRILTAPGNGVGRFLERFPHNRNKVEAALRRAVPVPEGDDGIPTGVPDVEG